MGASKQLEPAKEKQEEKPCMCIDCKIRRRDGDEAVRKYFEKLWEKSGYYPNEGYYEDY